MNRYLALPLALSVICFAGVYSVQNSYGEPAKKTVLNKAPLTFDQARAQILDGWPTLDEHAFGSRSMPTQPLYAELQQIVWRQQPVISDDANSILTSIRVTAHPGFAKEEATRVNGKKLIEQHGLQHVGWLPLHVDRYTHEVRIFHNRSWRPYEEWQDEYLPIYMEATGWKNKG